MKKEQGLSLRRTTLEDCRFIYDLRNEETVRQNSFHSEIIPYEQHEQWFAKKVKHPMVRMYILMFGEERIGQVRVDIEGEDAEISYALCDEARGHGYSKWMLSETERQLTGEGCCSHLIGEVMRENIASRRIFQSLGYDETETEFGYFYRKDI